jgi:NADH:ubiquinone oxidoreductase subunit 2 (subunit N)
MYMREPGVVINPLNPPPGVGLALAACALATLALGIFPQQVLALAREGVRLLL